MNNIVVDVWEETAVLEEELRQTRIWLQEILCVLMNGVTFEGFIQYCDAYDLDASKLLEIEAAHCNINPIEVDWSVAMARDIWERAGFQKEQELWVRKERMQGVRKHDETGGINTSETD